MPSRRCRASRLTDGAELIDAPAGRYHSGCPIPCYFRYLAQDHGSGPNGTASAQACVALQIAYSHAAAALGFASGPLRSYGGGWQWSAEAASAAFWVPAPMRLCGGAALNGAPSR